ncbi:basic secretory family protein (plasmid) [Pseudoalteromonas xiamenensis]|uniref:basic secretory protein-like protein n=1 Tax=Pseudoalteromonas xiamenensis TaxID=882626 RepID=UPI0027E3C93D|nr:basic secretory protein-like protein [Pseudoalteromonas xiamenensis]WMN62098.1 basic secretory family protein [Pseudoalteromonas xiamenensis]
MKNIITTLGLFFSIVSPAAYSQIDTTVKAISFAPDEAWQSFRLPKITLVNEVNDHTTVWSLLTPGTVSIVSERVARLLYLDVNAAPSLPVLTIALKEMKGVAYKDGDFNSASIFVSREYLENFQNKNGQQKAYDELIGILFHEIAHAYQYDDRNYEEIGPIIEGIADLVRLKAGYISQSVQKVGGHYDSGYKTTAFYLHWLESNNKEDYLVKINESLSPYDDVKWSWPYFAKRFGVSLEASWSEYQKQLAEK